MKYIFFLVSSLTLFGCSEPAVNRYNTMASLPDTGLLKQHEWKVITSMINKNQHTMSVLYGNDPAVKSARSGQEKYPADAQLWLVTWKQQPDEHWFGALVPGAVESVEQVMYDADHISPIYTKYTGNTLMKTPAETADINNRIAYIVSRRASVMP